MTSRNNFVRNRKTAMLVKDYPETLALIKKTFSLEFLVIMGLDFCKKHNRFTTLLSHDGICFEDGESSFHELSLTFQMEGRWICFDGSHFHIFQ